MADCSKTKVFFEELDRMCNTVNKDGEVEDCAFYKPHYGCCGHMDWLPDGVEKAMTILQKWSNEHPKKTRQSEFLKMFPNALMDGCTVAMCPVKVDENVDCRLQCDDCRKDFWLAEVK